MGESGRNDNQGPARPLSEDVFGIFPVDRDLLPDATAIDVNLDESWRARIIVKTIDEAPRIVGVSVNFYGPTLPRDGLPLRRLRRISESEVMGIYTSFVASVRETGMAKQLGLSERSLRPMHSRKRGRKATPDEEFARIAHQYVQAVGSGVRRPVQHVAQEMCLTEDHVRDLLARARKLGILTTPPAGRAGGTLTPLGEQLLSSTSSG